ncbi:MAG: hypothetical protein KGI28_06775 [Thaumarchaeota archaeon]|nr:hypothetical protein [Nitrososphaerota archaeon]
MTEFCENCGKPMDLWDATHCSEECILESIKNSKSLSESDRIDRLIKEMRVKRRYDINLLETLR